MIRKRVLLAMQSTFELDSLMKSALEKMGYEVTVITQNYKLSLLEKGLIVFNEIILKKDRKITHSEFYQKYKDKILKGTQEFDITLVINIDFFNLDFLNNIRGRSEKMIVYFFDGLKFSKTLDEKIHFFDKIYVFDKDDINKYPQYNLIHATNFYFKNSFIKTNNEKFEIDFYYLTFFNESKKEALNYLAEVFEKYNISYKFDILWFDMGVKNAKALNREVPYKEYLKRMNKSKFILDILLGGHFGVSFRVIESLWYKKKVVTTNPAIKGYDFYCPQNIFIVGDRPIEELPDFLGSEYKEIAPEIVAKYSFENWFNEKIKN